MNWFQSFTVSQANDPKLSDTDPGGRSFFADGFRIARWLEENEPAAYHVLTSTPVRLVPSFAIGMKT